MKRAIPAYHEPHLREIVMRATQTKGEERRGFGLELIGYLASCFGVCPHCGATATKEHCCPDHRARRTAEQCIDSRDVETV